MKLTNTLHRFKTLFLAKRHNISSQLKIALELCAIGVLATLIWVGGPYLNLQQNAFLASPEKRLYLILFIFLLWLLKFLLFDLTNALHFYNAETRKKLKVLQSRFEGVLLFLKQTTVTRHGLRLKLNQLPWYLLIGPSQAGKTTLLANSKIHYVLQRQFQANEANAITASEQCDWWITRDTSIIDVPGKYMAMPQLSKNNEDRPAMYLTLWKSFLNLLKKHRGRHPLDGVIIALPLPEIMKQGDPKKYQTQIKHLFLRLAEIAALSNKPLPCQIVITKCDQLAGFSEFFAESSDEEIIQSWGIALPKLKASEKLEAISATRFDMLVKKLNQQLLFRLHQERNPMARPYIKDFPLQVERLKECALDFIKKFSQANFNFSLQGIYFTSALQTVAEPDNTIIDDQTSSERGIQLFKAPLGASRAYFIKQFLLQALTQIKPENLHPTLPLWKKRAAYAASAGIIATAAILFGNDFAAAIKQAYAIQNTLSEYQFAMQKSPDADEQLNETLALLNRLQQTANATELPLNVKHLLTFYSNKARQKSVVVYQHALENILLPELKIYLSEFLKKPVNKNAEQVYAALKSYLMLGDQAHYQAGFIENTMRAILPTSFSKESNKQFLDHLKLALASNHQQLALDQALVIDTRRYLTALPNFQLGYIILKNINNNTSNAIDLEAQTNIKTAFNHRDVWGKIPTMYTAKAFATIFNQDATLAANEASQGNWVLGNTSDTNTNSTMANVLLQQLRTTYVSNYVNIWESMLANVRLTKPENLAQTNVLIANLVSNDSPLLRLLQTLHDNTYFVPITNASSKLQNIGVLVDKNTGTNNQLYQIFTGLQALHQYINNILTAENERKAAFDAVTARMQYRGAPDTITQLRLIADKSPEPVKSWLNKVTNDAWRFLMQDATRYIDLSWQEQVSHIYENEIANHFPFSANATQEVPLDKFTDFFGNSGTLMTFYNHYLLAFIDTSTPEWRWKTLDNLRPAFPDDTLHQIQTAYNINHMFFPNGDDKLQVQFALKPYQLSKLVKSVHLRINGKNITDQATTRTSHLLSWPNNHDTKMSSVQFTLSNQQKLNRDYPGDWGWFKLINQSTVNSVNNKEILINFSEQDYPVKYLLFTNSTHNPFHSINLQTLQLPKQLIEKAHNAA